jgi:hypothetical protein
LFYFAFLKDVERAGLQYKILKHNSNEYRSINNNGIDAGNRNLQYIFSISIDYSAKAGTRPFSENDEEEVRQDAENK